MRTGTLSVHLSAVALLLPLANCASDQMRRPAPVVLPPGKQGYVDAGKAFVARAPQPGQRLPDLWVIGMDGESVALKDLRDGRPMLVVTASMTSPIARRAQSDVDLITQRWGDRLAVVVLYTLEAHPTGDASPYTGLEWIPVENVQDGFQFRQPTTQMERMIVAREYQDRFVRGSTLVVDTMDNVNWRTLGLGPNMAVLVDETGTVVETQGWFSLVRLGPALEARFGAPASSTAHITSPGSVRGRATPGECAGAPTDSSRGPAPNAGAEGSAPGLPTGLPPGLAPELRALFSE